jgi:NCS2 family nucleobase:cation symporter-2
MGDTSATVTIDNIYRLDGKVPISKAIPFGLQHVLAMFVANIVPIIIVAGAVNLSVEQRTMLIQNAMFIAGIGTMVQLYPVWRIGSRLPMVMGVSFTFVSILCYVGVTYGYGAVVGSVIVGGLFEGTLGLFAKYWRKIISPIVAACVVTAIGFSLFVVGANSFGGGFGSPTFGSEKNLFVATVTLVSCLAFGALAKGFYKQLAVFFSLIVGYVLAVFLGMVDFSPIASSSFFSLPHFLPFKPIFNAGAIVTTGVIFLVSATETIGDTTAMVAMGLDREPNDREISGSLACDGFCSSISGLFGCTPITSFSQNVGLVAMTKVVNRFTLATGALCLILAGLFPPIGAFFATLPDAVLGGCTIMMFGQIVVSGIRMISKCGFTQRNNTIVALSLCIGLGFTSVPAIFDVFPQMVKEVLANNSVALVFVVSVFLNLVLPKDMEQGR